MPQIINTNISSLTAQRNLNASQTSTARALERLSSGLRVNSAKDDAAGLAISTRFSAQTRGLAVAIRNAGDGISLSQTAEGALGAMTSSLQRVRELALQASNSTNSDVDREALNQEAQQLISEVKRVSEQTQFNGTKLLDGTFSGATFQIGANVGETIAVNISKATVDSLGGGTTASVSAHGTASGIVSGDLVINGIIVGPSLASYDNASTASQTTSAISKVAAINKLSEQTNVKAEALVNTSSGTSQAIGATTSGSITLNGVTINMGVSTSLSLNANRDAIVTAINANSAQTGVKATNTGSDTAGITMEAADGRNITIAYTTVTAAATGLGAAGTYQGGYVLRSTNGENIKIEEGAGGTLSNSGVVGGTYKPSEASVSANVSNGTALSAGDVTINGVTIGNSLSTDDTASSSNKSASAIAKTAAINRATVSTGVRAVVNANTVVGAAQTAVDTTGTITINGITTASVGTTTDAALSRSRVVDAINAISGQTGVRAVDTGSSTYGVRLIADDGRNIVHSFTTLTSAATGIAAATTTYGTYTLFSAKEITVAAGTGTLGNSGLLAGTYGGSSDGQYLKDLNISTVDGAEKAIKASDFALQIISGERAKLGAVQNRFENTIANLAINSENLVASNSRIMDADFAAETANLSRSQVLQQAGISILAQANALSQNVLNLLR